MVNVFIIHSGKDYDYVKSTIEPYLKGEIDEQGNPINGECNSNVLTLESGIEYNWKRDARRKIKMAQVVIVVIGSDANNESKGKTMGWEVHEAIKKNKQIMIVNRGDYKIPEYLICIDRFTSQSKAIAKEQTLDEIKLRIDDFSKGYYNIFSKKYEDMKTDERLAHKNELVDQYKMFQKTSEDLVSRRQNVNSFYISVNSALVALMGVVMGSIDMPTKTYVLMFMCVAGIILDFSWIHLLEAYGTLNAAKMKVINLMEEQLPVALYEVEWRVMSDKLNNKRYVSFTNSEKRVPKLFLIVYTITFVASIFFVIQCM